MNIIMLNFKILFFIYLVYHQTCDLCNGAFNPNVKCVELKGHREFDYYSKGGSECWRLFNPGNKIITLRVMKLIFANRNPCHLDYLTIERDGDDSLKTLCSNSDTPFYITSESTIEVKFRAEKSKWDTRLQISYEIRDIRCSDENVFRCSNLNCVSRFKLCDGVMDCMNGADERNCSNYENVVLSTKASPTKLRDCIEFLQDEEENDEKDENLTKQDLGNGTVASEQSNSSQVPSAFREKVKKVKEASIPARAADAVFFAKEAVRIFYENEEKRAQERHAWEKERVERERVKHAKLMELLQVKIDSEAKD